ncbi:peroxisome assembly protein (Peroxin-2) [Glutinoglossum americanum]|uniref:Peroxisome assembly protein (Peroxin-2) n=1 Tax=Glutinoglossum americanum TaxID=1670608 RepID=A0A9P8L0T9_9PEZI|nr:peroxisome assembly protein (Peroxin-2) [Glutinoglossum americanum]
MTSADFSLAQERLAARRRLREAESEARLTQRKASHVSTAFDQLPFPFSRIGRVSRDAWDSIKGREGTRPAFRVGQVDAELLDEELLELLKGQFGEALKYFGPNLKDDWSAEILFALRAVLFKITIWDHNTSYGAALQNLKYTDARNKGPVHRPPAKWQKGLYGLFTVGGRYAWSKWEDWLVEKEGGYEEISNDVRFLSRITSLLSATHSIAAFASFLVFLLNGRYRTLLDRILRLRLAPPTNQVSREVSFEYLNRQLVWHAFTEFLLFVLPLVGIGRWRRWLSRGWRKTKSILRSGAEESENGLKSTGELHFLPERTCAICYHDQNPTAASENEILAISSSSGGIIGSAQTDVTNPYETIPCGCIYCFVCLAQKLEAEEGEGWICLRCGDLVKECKPWNGDVLEEPATGSRPGTSGKTVGFSEEPVDDNGKMKMRVLEPRPEESSEEDVGKGVGLGGDAAHPRDLVESSGEWAEVSRASPGESTDNSMDYGTPELDEDDTEGS